MRGSWRLGKISGIEVNVHWTFLLLLAWIGLSGLFSGGPLGSLASVVAVLILFGIVVLHEWGHAMAARYYGISTRDITLLPIGGLARLARMPDDPKQELVVAAAGPAVNLVLAGAAAVTMNLMYGSGSVTLAVVGGGLMNWLVWANLVLAVFNLLPAFPMDGGRILRAGLALRMSYLRATAIATRVGRTLGIAFGLFGLFTFKLTLALIGAFVWFGAASEMAMVKARAMGFVGSPLPGRPEVEILDDPHFRPIRRPEVQYAVQNGPFGRVVRLVRRVRLP